MSEVTLKFGGYAPAESSHSRALDRFADFVRQESDGRIDVDILYNIMDEGRSTIELLDMVTSGELDVCYYSMSYLGSSVPLVDALEIPFLFDTLDEAHAALDGSFGARISEAIESERGFKVLGYWDNGFRHLTNAVRPLCRPDDCIGLTIRVQPNLIHSELVKSWGMRPVLVELSEAIRLLESGEVDAQENPVANTVAYGVTHQHLTLSAHLYGARGLFANSDRLRGLDESSAEIVREGARLAILHQRDDAQRYEEELLGGLEAEGRQIVSLSEPERRVFKEAAGMVIAGARASVPSDLLDLLG
jgi:TRAP-type transport system periplasmic protein